MFQKIWKICQKEYYIREIVLLLFIAISLLFFGIYTSLAIFEKTIQKENVVNLVSGEIEFYYSSTEEDYNTTTNQITVEKETTKYFDITLINLLSIDTKYKLYYKPIIPLTLPSNVTVGMSIISQNLEEDMIPVSDNTKVVRVAIENNSTETITVEIGAQGGYSHNDVVLKNDTFAMTTKIEETIPVFTYEYQNEKEYESFLTPKTGQYKLEVWGASGGSGYGTDEYQAQGGAGGYASGIINLQEEERLYIYVGSQGGNATNTTPGSAGYNGGVAAKQHEHRNSGGSGGASDIRIQGHTLYNRIIVAGGGGAGSATTNPNVNTVIIGGYAGGQSAGNGQYGTLDSNYILTDGKGGTQSTGGEAATYDETMVSLPTDGSFGIGGLGALSSSWSSAPGGGGWYGGGGANYTGGGGGGSSYVFTSTSHKPENYTIDSKYYMTIPNMFSGIETMPTHDGINTMIGNVGNGFIKITYIDE